MGVNIRGGGSFRKQQMMDQQVATASDSVAAPHPRPSRRRRRLWIAAAVVLGGIAAYFVFTAFVAYTSDAYVRSDLVEVAPEVAGIIKSVAVIDNQRVKTGDLLAQIDPAPYELDVALKTQQVAVAQAQATVKTQAEAAAKATVDASKAELVLAQRDFDRIQELAKEGNAAQVTLDKARADLRAAQDAVTKAEADALVTTSEAAAAATEVKVAEAALAIAQYALSRTRIAAPVDGFVNNLGLRPGTYVAAGQAIIGIVDSSQWRVIANFKENVAATAMPGTPVWVWLDSQPWNFYPGKIQGVGRGIARSRVANELLPYVEPTTDWIRLLRRLPVTVYLDPPLPEQGLFMGSDARVFFFR